MSASLVIAGTGFQLGGHLTASANAWIRDSDHVFFVAGDPATAVWLQQINPNARDLRSLVERRHDRRGDAYQAMAEEIVSPLREGQSVCAVFPGHPVLLTDPAHRARELAMAEGFPVRMLPAISAEGALFADLGLDPGETGWQSFDATDFLIHRRRFDPHSIVLLYQVAMVGASQYRAYDARCLPILTETLAKTYGLDHEVIVYEASPYVTCDPVVRCRSLADLDRSDVSANSLLFVPPLRAAKPDVVMIARLARASAEYEAAQRRGASSDKP